MPSANAVRTLNSLQLPLFPHQNSLPANDEGMFKDPAFASNKKIPIHRWVPWIAGFSSEFVRDALGKYLSRRGVVLDPFAGVGTSLVEASLAGHKAVGFEINPYAALVCRTKLNACRINLSAFRAALARLESLALHKNMETMRPRSAPPLGFRTRGEFYSPKVLRKVLILMDVIRSIRDPLLRDLFRVAFGATMVSYSNYSYEPSLGQRKSAGRDDVEDYPVLETVLKKLMGMRDDILVLKQNGKLHPMQGEVFNESFFNCKNVIEPNGADLVVTSPPYLNNYHYNRNTRPHLYWLGFAVGPEDMKPLEESNFGKFWQTVREERMIGLDFNLKNGELSKQLKRLRKIHPEKGIYGGNGWANYAASYFNDTYRFVKCTKYALKRGGTALVVIGNSILQGIMIPTDQHLGTIAEECGMKLIDIHIPRQTRVGNSIIQSDVRVRKANGSHKLYEAIVELRKK